jgi:hypothetical protein
MILVFYEVLSLFWCIEHILKIGPPVSQTSCIEVLSICQRIFLYKIHLLNEAHLQVMPRKASKYRHGHSMSFSAARSCFLCLRLRSTAANWKRQVPMNSLNHLPYHMHRVSPSSYSGLFFIAFETRNNIFCKVHLHFLKIKYKCLELY